MVVIEDFPAAPPDMAAYIAARLRDDDRRELNSVIAWDEDVTRHCALWLQQAEQSFLVSYEGRPAALVAAGQLWPGSWWAAAWGTDEWPRVILTTTRIIKYRLAGILALHAHRIECRVAAWRVNTHRWLAGCGGVQEARLSRYGRDQSDFLVFRWTREDQ